MNIQMLMQQANKMKKDMEKAHEEVSKMTFTAKQPLVEVTVNGDKKVLDVKISDNTSQDDIDLLQDMILLAMNDALKQASDTMEQKLGKFSSGIPGLF